MPISLKPLSSKLPFELRNGGADRVSQHISNDSQSYGYSAFYCPPVGLSWSNGGGSGSCCGGDSSPFAGGINIGGSRGISSPYW